MRYYKVINSFGKLVSVIASENEITQEEYTEITEEEYNDLSYMLNPIIDDDMGIAMVEDPTRIPDEEGGML